MRIIQIVSWLGYGDAIGNEVLALDRSIKKRGLETKIYAESIDTRIDSTLAENFTNYIPQKSDVILLHISAASNANDVVAALDCKKIMVYHNITPPEFFEPYNQKSALQCKEGLEQVKKYKNSFGMVLAVSEFNKKNLLEMGYTCEINVLPIIISFDDYAKEPSKKILEKYNDDYANILFVGRIAPNKKQEDIIQAFNFYQKNYNPKSRLFLVGNSCGFENYQEKLKEFAKRLEAKNVIFTGHTKFNEILAYYKLSDLFLCMSEHEGFCVPLVESMYFKIPVVAYNSTAIPSTLGKSGFLLNEKNPAITGAIINKILTDNTLKNDIIINQTERLSDFAHKKIETDFWKYIKKFL